MKMLALDLISVMIQLSWCIASLGELASGVRLRPWMIFHIFGLSEFDIASWRRSFQLSVLALLVASVASWQVSSHSCQFWCIVWWKRSWVCILACICGVIQHLDFLLGLDFHMWFIGAKMRMSLKWETRRDNLSSSMRLFIFDLTLFLKQD